MIIYVNKNNEIKDVGTSNNEKLTPIELDDNVYNPFSGWSTAKICCYAIQLEDSKMKGFYPYVDNKIIEHIDRLGRENDALKQANMSTQAQVDYVTMMSDIDI
jgi:hypothetical protein